MIQRNIRFVLEAALKRSPVVLLLGARQTGKTTLMQQIKKIKKYYYVSFDDINQLTAARHDPMGFIANIPKPVIFDEIQRVPELFLAIKHDVDQHRIPGRYALTGSANPLLIPQMGDSLAGRMEIVHLYPFSQGEILGHFDHFIDTIWDETPFIGKTCQACSKENLIEKMILGGYPPIQEMSGKDRTIWFNNYTTAILQKDILDLAHIEGLDMIPRLLHILATYTGCLTNISQISRSAGITHTTLKRYLVYLETLFIIYFQQAWSANLKKQLMKSPKLFFNDTGLLSWLLRITHEKIQTEPTDMGHVLENFVVMELKKQATWNNTPVWLHHFRTLSGQEVDIVLERTDGKLIGIEVKSNGTIYPKDLKGLELLQEQTKNKWYRGIILYTGNQGIPLGETITALPISALWSFSRKNEAE